MTENIYIKVQAGNFWGKNGAIANTRKLALFILNQPNSNLVDGLSLMIDVHTEALEYSKKALKKSCLSYRIRLWKKRREKSKRALWFYNTFWRILSFFSYV